MRTVCKPIHPALMMIAFWTVVYATYLFAPITQTPAVSLEGFMFVCMMIFIFVMAALIGSSGASGTPAQRLAHQDMSMMSPYIRQLLNTILLIGIVGGLMSIYGKMESLKDMSLMGLSALRQERASELLEATQVSRGPFSAIGFLCYPAGFVGIVVALTKYEQLQIFTRGLAVAYLPVIFLLSLAAGGRSPILVLILFVVLAIYLRRCRGLAMIPQSKVLKGILVGLIIAFLVYSTIIWQVRADLAELDLEAFLQHAKEVWGVAPTATLEWLAEALGQPALVRSIMNTVFYFTQSLSTLEKVITMNESPILLGGYHVDLVAAALRFFPDGLKFLGDGYAALLKENIYGFFAGAWGGFYIDFGLLGCILGVAFWGWFAGHAYRVARHNIHSNRVVLYVFWMYSILISFVSPPFGFSNSAVTFFWFVVYFLLSAHPIRLSAAAQKA